MSNTSNKFQPYSTPPQPRSIEKFWLEHCRPSFSVILKPVKLIWQLVPAMLLIVDCLCVSYSRIQSLLLVTGWLASLWTRWWYSSTGKKNAFDDAMLGQSRTITFL